RRSLVRLLRLLENLDETPTLRGAQGAGLADDDEVADAGRVRLVVHLALLGATDDLAVEGVLHAVLNLDDDRLVHLVAHDVAALRLAVTALEGALRGGGVLRHYLASSVLASSVL